MSEKVKRIRRNRNAEIRSAEEEGGMPVYVSDPPGFSSGKTTVYPQGEGQTILSAMELAKFLEKEIAARDSPGWYASDIETFPGSGDKVHGTNLTFGNAARETYAPQTSFPRTIKGKFERIDYWLENDELIERLVSVKEDICAMGFSLRASRRKQAKPITPEESESVAVYKDTLDLIEKKWDFDSVVSDLLREWISKDTMILYWKIATATNEETAVVPESGSKEELIPGLVNICALNPADCNWDNSFGQDQLEYKIHWMIQKRIQDAINCDPKESARRMQLLLNEGIEQKYIDAVKAGKTYVLLKKEDGDRWIIKTRGNRLKGFRCPSMSNIFAPLEIRRSVADGDFAASFLMKHFIFHVTQGESIDQGPLAGQRMNWAGKKEIETLHNVLKKVSKAFKLVTDHTVKFNFIYPPKEMWDTAKYAKAEARMYNWGGMTLVIMTGDGGTNASGFIGIKRLIANITAARKKIKLALFEFFDSPEIKNATKKPDNCNAMPTFDENVLKDPKQLLDEIRTMLSEGIGDPSMSLDELGRDSETVKDAKARSIEENDSNKLWTPLNSKDNKQESQATAGRPPNSGTTPNEGTRLQSPTT